MCEYCVNVYFINSFMYLFSHFDILVIVKENWWQRDNTPHDKAPHADFTHLVPFNGMF